MLEFFLAGGVPMFGVLVCGVAALVAAIRFAMSPDKRKVAAVVALSVASTSSSLLGFAADVSTTFRAVSQNPEWQKPELMPIILLQGIHESFSPVILGFALLTVIWLVMAVGFRRLAPRLPAV